MRGFYASGILTRRGFAAWKSWTNIFRNSVPSFRCWTLHAFVPTLEQFRDLVYTLHETKERRRCVFSDRWFESWRWLWPWRIFDERKSFVSGQISTRLRNSFGYIDWNSFEGNRTYNYVSPSEEKREISWDFESRINFISAGEKRNVNETCMQNVWIEKCSEGKQRLTRKT